MRAKAMLRGLLSHVPGFDTLVSRIRDGGGTASGGYCYSVWLRHVVMAHDAGLNTNPKTVAELGPGDSIGVGMAALLSGSERYWALDVNSYANPERNLRVFDEIADLFASRAPIPDGPEMAEVKPALESYAFPSRILSDDRLRASLAPPRLARLRESIRQLGVSEGGETASLSYMVSWQDATRIRPATVDVILSQAVLEHVEDVRGTYHAMHAWLRPGGYMSHQIDFRSHGLTTAWNGHWGVSDFAWTIAKGKRGFLLNREPCSRHLHLARELGFRIVREIRQRDEAISRELLAPRFRELTDDDLRTSGLFLQAVKT